MKKALLGTASVTILVILVATCVLATAPQNTARAPKAPAQVSKATEASRLNNLGAAYMNQQAFEKALKYFQEAYAADPQMFAARLNQGIALLNLQKVADALPILQQAIKLNPKSSRAWYNLGLLYKSSGDAAQALEAFKNAAELE